MTLGQYPSKKGGSLTYSDLREVKQSSHAIGGHGEKDKGKNVVKENGTAKEALSGVVCMNANCLQVLKAFKTVVDTGGPLSNLNPIAQVAVGLLSNAAQTILDQDSRDESAFALPIKVQEVYEFLLEKDALDRINKRGHILVEIAQVVGNCTEFIAKYAERKNFAEDFKVDGMFYARDVGLMTGKKCLDGTREELLADIIRWIGDPDPHAPQAEHPERRIFTTIAHDLANRDPLLRRAVADAIAADDSLKTTPDAIQQWEKLIVPAVKVLSAVVGKVVVVIDALDEAGSEVSRKDILDILATRTSSFPTTFRILITSRPFPDVQKALKDLPHAKMSLDDVPIMNDIRLYIATELAIEHNIDDAEIERLAGKSDGLFEWARLACGYIKASVAGQTVKERFDEVMSRESEEGKLLDGMCKAILDSVIGKKAIVLKRFHSVMQQILSTLEPVPMHTLDAMRGMFPDGVDHYKVKINLEFMDVSRSGDYFAGGQTMDGNLASASLSILQSELQFNICKLDTSYMCN
ncbi:hypothetical protein ID866_10854, partial [Astraeus odoratus]